MKTFTPVLQKALLLWVIYLFFTSNLEPANLMLGFLIGLGISLLVPSQQLVIAWRRLPGALWAAARYLVVLAGDLLKSGIQVGRLVLDPGLPIEPGIVDIDAGTASELSTALSAHAISLTPGELVIEMDENGQLFTHCLEAGKSAEFGAEARQLRQNLLVKIFE